MRTPSSYLDLQNIWVSYWHDKEWVLRGLNLQLKKGECLGIIGNNGSGKSTLAHALIGVIPYITPGQIKGDAYLDNKDLFSKNLDERLSQIGYSFQDIESQVLFGKVSDVLGMRESDSNKELLRMAVEYLQVGHLLKRSPDELSGGEAQRVALITALRRGPNLVLYDEATSALDPTTRRAFGRLLTQLKSEGRIIILLGQRSEILKPYCSNLRALINGRLSVDPIPRCVDAYSRERAEDFWYTMMKHQIRKKIPELKLNGIKFTRKRFDFTLGPIDLHIAPGEIIAVVGPNGSGKTTLFLLLMGILRSGAGTFVLGHREYTSARNHLWVKTITMTFQSPLSQIIGATVQEELKETVSSMIPLEEQQIRNQFLEYFPYLSFDKDPLQLSYGQQRMLTLIGTLLSDHPIFIIEEPEQGLDSSSLEYIKAWFRMNRQNRTRTVLFSTHDLELAAELSDRCLLLVNGKVVSQISTDSPTELENWYFINTKESGI
jgi:energy-coupling factor transport system ATP-binding protein